MTPAAAPIDRATFAVEGCAHVADAVDADTLDAAAHALAPLIATGPGARLTEPPDALSALIARGGALCSLAEAAADEPLRPARVLAFDKRAGSNWGVGWHQDRMIAVAGRREAPGFAHWSARNGVQHVEPPFALLARMRTVRLHLDDCGADNGALETLPGSHALGRLSEDAVDDLVRITPSRLHPVARGGALVLALPIVHRSKKAVAPLRRRVLHVDYGPAELPSGLEWALREAA